MKKWIEEDELVRHPVDEFENLPALRALGWTPRDLKALIRVKLLNGSIDPKGEASTSYWAIKQLVVLLDINAELSRALVATGDLEDLDMDFDAALLKYVLNRMFPKDVSVKDLRSLLKKES